ncbi:MAG TPA: alpha/beta fold hydrolase [Solirubrobacteraceae bacterium]|jgi:haloalkane dehalogenase
MTILSSREAGPADGPPVVLLHGYPESSYMWREILPALAAESHRALAPDLLGYGDSPVDRPHTWARQIAAFDAWVQQQALDPFVLVVHDWGGLIGLRWACDHPEAVRGLVISDTGFFADGRWHGLAEAMQTPEQGEQLVDGMTRESFGQLLGAVSTGIGDDALDEYFRAFADEDRRRGQLELYRSGDFAELARYEGRLAQLGVPALILSGADDPFAPVASAERFQREIPGSELVVLEGTGHFAVEDDPEAYAAALLRFLRR